MTLVAERCWAQLLSGPPAATPVDVAERLLAIQAQDPRGARLAVRARTTGLLATDVDRCLNDRELVITWLNRGTLHLVRVEDLPMLFALTTPQLKVGNARRLAQEGVSVEQAERGTQLVEAALADGPKTRAELREVLEHHGIPVAGQALVHVLMRTCLFGLAVRGPMKGADHAYVLVRNWLGAPLPVPDLDQAVVELARRYLAGHGPATDRDLARWAGIPLGAARRGLAGTRGIVDRGDGLVALRSAEAVEPPPPKLLGPFDPLLLGWADRTPIVGDHGQLVTSNGIFKAFALVDGTAAATWSMSGSIAPFDDLDPAVLADEAADVRRYMGSSRYR